MDNESNLEAFHVLNLGAGVQSTTIALMYCTGLVAKWVPKIDVAIFADTQEEPRKVYEHLSWLTKTCEPHFPVLVRTQGKLGNDLISGLNSTGQPFVSIPAFTTDREGNAAGAGMVRRQCTKEYKSRVIEQAIRRDVLHLAPGKRVPTNTVVHQYLGLSYDEPGRIFGRNGKPGAKARIESNKWSRAHFPLHEMYLTREMCRGWLQNRVPHEVPRSACTFCPFHDNKEWLRIKTEDQESWQRAVEVDRAIRDHDDLLFLHRSCLPLDKVDLTLPDPKPKQQDLNFSALECEGMCGL